MQVIQHLESAKHKKLHDETRKGAASKRAREETVEGWDDRVEEFLSTVMKEKNEMDKEKGTNFTCSVCGVSCNSMDNLNAHLASAKHKKRQLIMEGKNEEVGGKGVVMQCKVCNITCNGADNFEAHMKGKPHAKKVKLYSGQKEGVDGGGAASEDKA